MNKLFKSFKHALTGLKVALKENSFRVMLVCGIFALLFSFLLPLMLWERVIIVFLVGAVLSFELMNSQIERILDIIKPDHDERIKKIKDISSGAVLIISFTAFLIAVIIFVSKIILIL